MLLCFDYVNKGTSVLFCHVKVLDSLLIDGQINCGRVAISLAFAGCLAQHCVRTEIISSGDVDQLAEVMGTQLATRLINTEHILVRIHLLPV